MRSFPSPAPSSPSPAARRQFKDAIYEQFARIGKALASPRRLELLDLLAQGPRTVEPLAEAAELSMANASQHLQILRAARLVEAEKRGLYVVYRLADGEVAALWQQLRVLGASRLAEIEATRQAFFASLGALEPVHGDDLRRRAGGSGPRPSGWGWSMWRRGSPSRRGSCARRASTRRGRRRSRAHHPQVGPRPRGRCSGARR